MNTHEDSTGATEGQMPASRQIFALNNLILDIQQQVEDCEKSTRLLMMAASALSLEDREAISYCAAQIGSFLDLIAHDARVGLKSLGGGRAYA